MSEKKKSKIKTESEQFQFLTVSFAFWVGRKLQKLTRAPRAMRSSISAVRRISIRTRHDLRRQAVLFWLVAVIWVVAAIELFLSHGSSVPIPQSDPHPLITNAIHPETSFSIWPYLSLSAQALIPLSLGILCIIASRRRSWRRPVIAVHGVVVVLALVFTQASTLRLNNVMATSPQIQTISQPIVQRLACADAIRMVDNYTFGAKTFYDLQTEGYRLEASYDTYTGYPESEQACQTYYAIRQAYPASRIVLQTYLKGPDGQPQPYTYSDATMGKGLNGIFVKR